MYTGVCADSGRPKIGEQGKGGAEQLEPTSEKPDFFQNDQLLSS
jgi:hypothetical protein